MSASATEPRDPPTGETGPEARVSAVTSGSTEAVEPRSSSAPQRLGRYEITGELGKGAMGVVYAATDPVIGRTVALKTIREEVDSLPPEVLDGYRERFQREAKAAGLLNHPNIVTIYDAGQDEATGIWYIAMELIQGATLERALSSGATFPLLQSVGMVKQVASALDFAHKHGVIHRDVKPGNMILAPQNVVKLTDFGIARIATMDLTRSGQLVGTPNYMAPEQLKGIPVDHRADIFALGIVFYRLVTGIRPFQGENATSVSYQIVHEDPPRPTSVRPELPPACDRIAARTLAKSPEDRYEDGGELVADLDALIQEIEGHGDVPPPLMPQAVHAPDAATLSMEEPPGYRSQPSVVPSSPAATPPWTARPTVPPPAPAPRARWLLPASMGAILAVAAILVLGLWPRETPVVVRRVATRTPVPTLPVRTGEVPPPGPIKTPAEVAVRLFDLGECDAALLSFQTALESNPEDPTVAAYIAELQLLKSREAAAPPRPAATPSPAAAEPPNATILFENDFASGYLEVKAAGGASLLRIALSLDKGRDSAQIAKPFRIPKGKGALEVRLMVPQEKIDLQATIDRPPDDATSAVLKVVRRSFPKSKLSLEWK